MKLLIFDTYPVQYRVPLWRKIEEISPGCIYVVFANDCSVKGYSDKDFGQKIAWDIPLLEGYTSTFLSSEDGKPLRVRLFHSGKRIWSLIKQVKPDYILVTGLIYRYEWVVVFAAKLAGIKICIRCETQDEAFTRSYLKNLVRSLVYKMAYRFFDFFFYIGEKNKSHYLKYGVKISQLAPARYCTLNSLEAIDDIVRLRLRDSVRNEFAITSNKIVVGFSGKFISKKRPDLIIEMLNHLNPNIRSLIHLHFVGSGEMEEELRLKSIWAKKYFNVTSSFSGFVNQSQIAKHYLAMDILVLPSQKMGETWGLVVNEALQAGCSVALSDAVGCSADFGHLERVRIFSENNAKELSEVIHELSSFIRNFYWANSFMQGYSISASAHSIVTNLKKRL